ncbi:LAGLIDADG family homing endonuclease [Mycolicibacterium arenosum]|uniref:Endonuclease n=1 Tax=Mycolicibacterium arenosum TaxID=2952157 RepID=A0ABT1M9R2_9MYCO|nr:endonuclease [Mycolicibacterium sp. CAU 1645]
MAVADLVGTGERPPVWSLNERGHMVARAVSGLTGGGRREAFIVRLASGREMEASADTSLMTLGGWVPISNLHVGDRVAIPRRVPAPSDVRPMADDELVLLAHMIGDGSCVKSQPIRYASIDEINLSAVTKAALHFGVTAKRDDYAAARVTTLRLPAPYHLTHGRRNPVAAWLDGFGIFGKRSYEKFVPAPVFAAPNQQIALFLMHLWSTDGCITWDAKQRLGNVYYASTSRRLVDDVRQLLLRLGIPTRLYRVAQGRYRDAWHLRVFGAGNQRRFLTVVDAHGLKFFAAREVLSNLQGIASNENVDTVPSEVWDTVRQRLRDQGMSHRAFADSMGIKFCGNAMWKPSPSRSRLHRAAAILDDRGLHDLTTNDVLWDRVVEITGIGEQDVYRVEVDGADNVVANGISVRASHDVNTGDAITR